MADLISIERGPLEGWAIVFSNGKSFLGELSPGDGRAPSSVEGWSEISFWLEPVFELIDKGIVGQPAPNSPTFVIPQGHIIADVQGYVSIRRVFIPRGAIIIPMTELSREDRKDCANAARIMKEQQAAKRAAQAGVSVVSGLPGKH